jgi:glycosyltransferase involved in cell wall biosynthesis
MAVRVLFVHPNDVGVSGGTIAMHRLRRGLAQVGVASQILCVHRQLPPEDAALIPEPAFIKVAESLLRPVTIRMGFNDIHRLTSFWISKSSAFRKADVLDFHCLHGGYFNYLALPHLTRLKPAVITLHDMFPITGHCSFSFGCDRWSTGCGRCPHLDVFPAVWRDATRAEWHLKRRAYRRATIAAVSPSRWLAEMAQRGVFAGLPVHHIPLGVDTTLYRPREDARVAAGLPSGRILLLAAATSMKADQSDRKGGDLLIGAINALPAELRARSSLVLMGRVDPSFARQVPIAVIALGYVDDEARKASIYAAADCLVSSTRADNLPLVILESFACGTPTASFAVGGIPELVREGVTGALAIPENSISLAQAIERVITSSTRDQWRTRCRAIALAEYDSRLHVRRMSELYQTLVSEFTNGAHEPRGSRC